MDACVGWEGFDQAFDGDHVGGEYTGQRHDEHEPERSAFVGLRLGCGGLHQSGRSGFKGRIQLTSENLRSGLSLPLDLDEARPGDWIGEMALLTGQPRSATVTALEDATLVGLSREKFTQLRRRHPEIAEQLHNQILPRTQRRQLIQAFERLFGKLDMDVLRQLEQ